jgi:hypothetical protein
VFCCIVLWLHWFWWLLEWQQPAAEVDVAVDWPTGGGGVVAVGCGRADSGEQQRLQREQEEVLGAFKEEQAEGGGKDRVRRRRQGRV